MKLKNIFLVGLSILTSGFVLADENLAPLEVIQKKYNEEESNFKKLGLFKNKKLTNEYVGEEVREYKPSLPNKVQYKSYVKIEAIGKDIENPRENCYQKTLELLKLKPYPFVYMSEKIKNEPHNFKYDYLIIEDEVTTKDQFEILSFSDQFDRSEAHHLKDNGLVMIMDCEGDVYSPIYILSRIENSIYTMLSEQNILDDHGQDICKVSIINTYQAIDTVSVEKKDSKTVNSTDNTKTTDNPRTGLALEDAVPDKVNIKAGCQSDSTSPSLIFLIPMIFLVLKPRSSSIRFKKNLIVFFMISISFSKISLAQNLNPMTFNLKIEDLVNLRGYQVGRDQNQNIYLTYPSVCINESTDTYNRVNAYVNNYLNSERLLFVIAEKKCGQIDFNSLSESSFIFKLGNFPQNTLFNIEIVYFSDALPDQYHAGIKTNLNSFYAGDQQRLRRSNYRTFNSYYGNAVELINQIGLVARLSHPYPIGVNNFYIKNVSEKYELARLKTIGNRTVNINVENGQIEGEDYIGTNSNVDLNVKQFRQPFISSSDFGALNTVFLARLLLSTNEAFRICSDYALEYNIQKGKVAETEKYTDILQKTGDQNSTDIYTTLISYYYKSQKEIEGAINYLERNLDDSETGKELLIDGLKGVSLLQGNACLKSLTLDQLRIDPTGSHIIINNCYQSGSVTGPQKSILEQLISLGKTKYVLAPDFETKIKKIAADSALKQQKYLNLKTKIKSFYYQDIANSKLQASCKQGMGSDVFSEIIGAY